MSFLSLPAGLDFISQAEEDGVRITYREPYATGVERGEQPLYENHVYGECYEGHEAVANQHGEDI